MTDLAFAKYLAEKLLNSGEDCCAICAFNRRDDVCDNQMLAAGILRNNIICGDSLEIQKKWAEESNTSRKS